MAKYRTLSEATRGQFEQSSTAPAGKAGRKAARAALRAEMKRRRQVGR